MSQPSEWVAAGAALAAATVVAWQSWETRRSANASVKAVDAAERAVVAANEGLELSRQQVAEAIRARVDAATPAITVSAPGEPAWPPLEPSGHLGGEPQPLQNGLTRKSWHLPRDRTHQILVRTPVAIENHSDVTVTVRVTGLIDDAGQSIGDTLDLRPAERHDVWFGVTRNVDEWVAIHTQRAAGEGGVEATGLVYYLDPADTGATDRWELALTGTPVEPVPDMNGAWQLIDRPNSLSGNPGAMGVSPVLRERIYWLSKKRNQQLDP